LRLCYVNHKKLTAFSMLFLYSIRVSSSVAVISLGITNLKVVLLKISKAGCFAVDIEEIEASFLAVVVDTSVALAVA